MAEVKSYSFNDLHLADENLNIPFLHGNSYLMNGEIREWEGKFMKVSSPIYRQNNTEEPIVIGDYPMMDEATALEAVNYAHKAFNYGRGVWPTTHVSQRIKAVEEFANSLKAVRSEIIVGIFSLLFSII